MGIYYEIVADMNNLYWAFKDCEKEIRWKYQTQRFEANCLLELQALQDSLIDGSYTPSKPVEFDINERGKMRHIKAPCLKDKIVQKVMCKCVIEPILYKYLIYDNGASIKDKGVKFTRDRLVMHLHSYWKNHGNEGYILVGDFSKFFDSIPHDKLIEAVSKHINDEQFIELFTMMIKQFGNDTNGLGIGAEISQICGVFYPTQLDNYIKIVKGCKYYARHMDDFYVIHQDKEFLKELLIDIYRIADELGLKLNTKKTQICKINKGFVFLKQCIFVAGNGKVVQKVYKKNVTREKRKLKKFKKKLDSGEMSLDRISQQYTSWRGSNEEFDCYNTLESVDRLYKALFIA